MKASGRYDSLFKYYAEKEDFAPADWFYFKAQVRAESNFDPRAVSPVGAKGLAQFMPATWGEWGKGKDPFDPEASIDAQIRYMKWLLRRVTQWELAWAAYNWGIGNILKVWQDPNWKLRLPTETRLYIEKIKDFYEEYANGTA